MFFRWSLGVCWNFLHVQVVFWTREIELSLQSLLSLLFSLADVKQWPINIFFLCAVVESYRFDFARDVNHVCFSCQQLSSLLPAFARNRSVVAVLDCIPSFDVLDLYLWLKEKATDHFQLCRACSVTHTHHTTPHNTTPHNATPRDTSRHDAMRQITPKRKTP